MKLATTTAVIAATICSSVYADSIGVVSMKMKHRRGGMVDSGLHYSAIQSNGQAGTTSIAGDTRFKTARASGSATGLGSIFSTFSIELGQPNTFAWNSFEVRSLVDAPNPGDANGGALGADLQHRIHAVIRAAIDEGVIDARMQPTAASTEAGMAAVQLAVWEAVWETSDSLSLTDGSSLVEGAGFNRAQALDDALTGILDRANSYLTLNRSDFSSFKVDGLAVLSSSNAQDQLAIVPLPRAAFAGLGLLGAAGVIRRLRK